MEKSVNISRKHQLVWITKIATLLIVFSFILYLNIIVGYCTDDWHFKFVFQGFRPEDGLQRTTNLKNLLQSAASYYQLSGGRVLAHSITFAFLMLPQSVFDVINSIMFLLLGYLCYLLVENKDWREKWYALPAVFVGIAFFSFSFGDAVLWLSGATNYLWMSVLNLYAVFFFEKKTNQSPSWVDYVIVFVLFFLAGQSNETTGGMIIILLFFHVICKRKKENRFFYVVTALATVMGMGIVLFAPGNHNRAVVIHGGTATVYGILDSIITFEMELMNRCWILLAFMIFGFIFAGKEKNYLDRLFSYRWAVMGIAGTVALGFSNTIIMRGAFLPVIYILISGCNCLQETGECLNQRNLDIRDVKKVWQLSIAFAVWCFLYFISVLLQNGFRFSDDNILFLTRGLGVVAVFWLFSRISVSDRIKILVRKVIVPVGIGCFIILYILMGMGQLQYALANSGKQHDLELRVENSVYHEDEGAVIGWPLYQDSVFWPKEAGASAEYARAWMKAYYQWEYESNKQKLD